MLMKVSCNGTEALINQTSNNNYSKATLILQHYINQNRFPAKILGA